MPPRPRSHMIGARTIPSPDVNDLAMPGCRPDSQPLRAELFEFRPTFQATAPQAIDNVEVRRTLRSRLADRPSLRDRFQGTENGPLPVHLAKDNGHDQRPTSLR